MAGDIVADSEEPSKASLLAVWRSVIMLLPLVTAANYGHPSLGSAENSPSDARTAMHKLLDAFSSINIRDFDVTAVAGSPPKPTADMSSSVSSGLALEQDSYHLVIMAQNSLADHAIASQRQNEPMNTPTEDPRFELEYFNLECIPDKAFQYDMEFAALANPEHRDPPAAHSASPSECPITRAPDGKPHWSFVMAKDWSSLTIDRHDLLENHIATVVEYIKEYRKNAGTRPALFHKFIQYLVSTCWRKMRRRINQWASLGFITILAAVNEDELKFAFKMHGHSLKSLPKDPSLHALLIMMHENDAIEGIFKHYPIPEQHRRLPLLMAELHKAADSATTTEAACNEDICFEFHLLLIATLRGYGFTLGGLFTVDKEVSSLEQDIHKREQDIEKLRRRCDSMSPKQTRKAVRQERRGVQSVDPTLQIKAQLQNMEQELEMSVLKLQTAIQMRVLAAKRLYMFNRLLWRLAYSQMLICHLTLLRAVGYLEIPNTSFKLRYYKENPFAVQPPGLTDDDDGELSSYDDLAHTFQGWVRLQVAHWAALTTISSFARNSKAGLANPKISLLNMKHDTSLCTMEDWEVTIKNLALEHVPSESQPEASHVPADAEPKFDAQAAIAHIRKLVEEANQKAGALGIFRAFGQARVLFYGNMHCEAVLAIVISCIEDINELDDKKLKEILEALSLSSIGVSKLCCPVCNQLMAELRGESNDFQICGKHPTITPVELPPWIPIDTLKNLLRRFKDHLSNQIGVMMTSLQTPSGSLGHRRVPSQQSKYSATSDDSNTSHPDDVKPLEDEVWDSYLAKLTQDALALSTQR